MKRCYYIADSKVEHVLTDNVEEYAVALLSYVNILVKSPRLNFYSFGSIEVKESEYQARREASLQYRSDNAFKEKAKLSIVKEQD